MASTNTKAQAATYRLCDGIIIAIGANDSWLVDLVRGNEIRIDFRFIEPLEKLCLGSQLEGFEAYLPRLVEEKIVEEAVPGVDHELRKRIETLDNGYTGEFWDILSPRAKAAHSALLDAHATRKRFLEQVGQCPVLPETALRRALLVGDAEDVGQKRVVCVGDDDLVSVALASLGHKVTVLDIDDFLLQFLRWQKDTLGLDIEVVERDLRDPVGDISEQFDVFLTDPMSNRECFEVFLSRAFSMLAPGGVGYSAVFAPVERLFTTVAGEMGFEVAQWRARHNHYYSKQMKLHTYESDWVEIRPTKDLNLKYGPTEFCVPIDFYQEDYYQRPKNFASFVDGIEEEKYATPMFLDMLLDVLAIETGVPIEDRRVFMEDDWTVVHCPNENGYLSLHVDRVRKQIIVDLNPFVPDIEEPLRQLLLSGYKSQRLDNATVKVDRLTWDVRIR